MAILGAHMSMAGGYYKAVEIAARCGCDCVQLFTKNNNQWRAKEITQADVERFQSALKQLGIKHPISTPSGRRRKTDISPAPGVVNSIVT